MNSRNVVPRHYEGQRYLSCPVCQHAIDVDHDEAIAHEEQLNPPGCELPAEPSDVLDHDLVEIGPDQDILVEGDSFAIVETHDPDKTMPPR